MDFGYSFTLSGIIDIIIQSIDRRIDLNILLATSIHDATTKWFCIANYGYIDVVDPPSNIESSSGSSIVCDELLQNSVGLLIIRVALDRLGADSDACSWVHHKVILGMGPHQSWISSSQHPVQCHRQHGYNEIIYHSGCSSKYYG